MKKRISFLLFISAFYLGNAQSKLDKAIETLQKDYNQEKIYLLFDKDRYVSGDEIRFKTFVFEGYTKSEISNNLYAELYDKNQKLIDKKLIYLNSGEGEGSFQLDKNLNEDIYYVRAYTLWMENFPAEFEYIKEIQVYNPNSSLKLALTKDNTWDFDIYPEGGNLIEDNETKVAIRMKTKGLPPSNWSGYVIDKKNPDKKILSFTNLDENVAVFNLKPLSNVDYDVVIEDNTGKRLTKQVPSVNKDGVSLKVNSNNSSIQYEVKNFNKTADLKGYKIIALVNNNLAYKKIIGDTSNEAKGMIPINKSDVVNGIIQFYVFSSDDQIEAERLAFISPNYLKVSKPNFTEIKINNAQRALNSFNISNKDRVPNYTVVVKENIENLIPEETHKKDNLISNLWLTSDISTRIYSPNKYFEQNNNKEALDALLITEKWKRFSWKNLFENQNSIIKYQPEKNIAFNAKLAINSRAIPNTDINLIIKKSEGDSDFGFYKTNENGFINMNNLSFCEPCTIYYFLTPDKKTPAVPDNLTLAFKKLNEFKPFRGKFPVSTFTYESNSSELFGKYIARAAENIENTVKIKSKEIQIQEVILKVKTEDKTKKLNKQLSSGRFSDFGAELYDFINKDQNLHFYSSVIDWLRSKPLISFQRNQEGDFAPLIRDIYAHLFLNDAPISASFLSSLSVQDIALVKIWNTNSTIAIYTRKGNTSSVNELKDPHKNNKIVIYGYDKVTPQLEYDYTKETMKNISSDNREVLYWNTENDNKVSFYNNDTAKTFSVTIISFDKDGLPIYYEGILSN